MEYFIANRTLSELFLGMRVQKESDLGSDHFLTLAKLRFQPKWLWKYYKAKIFPFYY
jgi:hypothetical protein